MWDGCGMGPLLRLNPAVLTWRFKGRKPPSPWLAKSLFLIYFASVSAALPVFFTFETAGRARSRHRHPTQTNWPRQDRIHLSIARLAYCFGCGKNDLRRSFFEVYRRL